MNLPFYIAKRYLFSKKSHNAINVISIISVCGIIVATAALICALSVFNGFTSIAEKMLSSFDADLQISPTHGKVFRIDEIDLRLIEEMDKVELISESLEENALLKFSDREHIILLKGVTSDFKNLANIDELMYNGQFELRNGIIDHGVAGAGLAYHLGVSPGFLTPLEIYIPKRDVQVNLMNPSASFNQANIYLAGTFSLNKEEYDEQMLILSIDLARELLGYENEVSTIEIKLKEGVSVASIKQKIQDIAGSKFEIKDRFEQQADMYRMMKMEKWVTFFIIVIISAIAVFNVVGSLSMLIIEKKQDISIIKSMGASNKLIEKIFVFEGWFIVFVGALTGVVIGVAICLIQQYFGLLKLGSSEAFIVEAFPVSVNPFDILVSFATICIVGSLAVLYPILSLRRSLAS